MSLLIGLKWLCTAYFTQFVLTIPPNSLYCIFISLQCMALGSNRCISQELFEEQIWISKECECFYEPVKKKILACDFFFNKKHPPVLVWANRGTIIDWLLACKNVPKNAPAAFQTARILKKNLSADIQTFLRWCSFIAKGWWFFFFFFTPSVKVSTFSVLLHFNQKSIG